jgi:PAS domain S-box-containing protein
MLQGRLGAEHALRESEERFRLLVEGSTEVFFFRHGLDHQFEYLSPSVREVLGYRPEELIGKQYDTLLTGDPSDSAVHRNTDDAMRYGVRGQSYRATVRHKDGRRRILEVVEGPVLRRGKAVGLQGFAHDVTERQLAEEKLQEQARLLDLVPDAVVVVDMQDHIQFWSHGATQVTGIPVEQALGRRAGELDYWGLGEFETVRQLTLERGEWQGETVRFSRDRKKLTMSSRWKLVRDAAGAPRSVLVLESDITDRKRVEQQLLQAQRMHSMGVLAGGIAHDLNNILSPVLMAAQVLRADATDEYLRTMLDTIEGCAKRGAEVVKQLLTFARGIQGERVSVQARHLIKEVVQIAQETFPKSIKVTSNVPRELWPIVGDATQIHQVVLNLAVNARDAMPEAGTLGITGENVTLDETFTSMEPSAKPGPHVLITVTDTGAGMPPEVIEHIFEPFFTTKQTGKNPGLGLSTVLGIVQNHGGFIRLTSQVGKGTAFKVFFPASPGAQPGGATPARKPPRGRGELILLVDDEAGIRDSTTAMLTRNGYEVVTAADGAEGMAMFADRRAEIRVVLVDIVMPLMDGVALVRGLRKIAGNVRVVAASGLLDDVDQAGKVSELKKLGVERFLTKPFTADELLETLSSALQGVGAETEK